MAWRSTGSSGASPAPGASASRWRTAAGAWAGSVAASVGGAPMVGMPWRTSPATWPIMARPRRSRTPCGKSSACQAWPRTEAEPSARTSAAARQRTHDEGFGGRSARPIRWHTRSHRTPFRDLFLSKLLELPFVHAGHPVPAFLGRWADPRVAENVGITQGVQVRPVLVDPCVYVISFADGPVAGDEDVNAVCHAFEQPQRGEVVLDRVSAVQVEHRNQDIGKHVAGDENAVLLDQQRRVARGVRLVLDDPYRRTIPRDLRRICWKAGDEAEQVQRYLLGELRRQNLGDADLPVRIRQQISDISRAAGCAV